MQTQPEGAKGIPSHPPAGSNQDQKQATKPHLEFSSDRVEQTYGGDRRYGFGGHIGGNNRQGWTGMALDPREHGLGGLFVSTGILFLTFEGMGNRGYAQMVKQKAHETKEGQFREAEEKKHKWEETHPHHEAHIPQQLERGA